jgi:hypothetical protein
MSSDQKIQIGNRIVTREDIWKSKEAIRIKNAKLPFEEKIKMLKEMQEIADNIKNIKERK